MSDKHERRSPDEIEEEIRQTREELDDTLHELEDRLSPKYFVDSAYNHVRNGGANEFLSNLGNTIKQNPFPVLLIGVGIGWLMMSQSGKGQKAYDKAYAKTLGRKRHDDASGRHYRPGTVMPATPTASTSAPPEYTDTVTGTNRSGTTSGVGTAAAGPASSSGVVGEATHLGTAQHKGGASRSSSADVVGEATHLGTQQHREGYPGSKM
ncbi:DUF3618 domain-containing protein [Modicisalibacter xianhensis]|uniref:DUF3618 domain-containing protein n=1 Tax=Modicisalibacter xianhensis TaxID=442341 RepID=A0A1I2YQB2_9GAMM|nr:DUF3618 domain-containing protein [Halomonas xianhensis]SFH27680.1 Protein of unknown function [Halomonas xianhensis]